MRQCQNEIRQPFLTTRWSRVTIAFFGILGRFPKRLKNLFKILHISLNRPELSSSPPWIKKPPGNKTFDGHVLCEDRRDRGLILQVTQFTNNDTKNCDNLARESKSDACSMPIIRVFVHWSQKKSTLHSAQFAIRKNILRKLFAQNVINELRDFKRKCFKGLKDRTCNIPEDLAAVVILCGFPRIISKHSFNIRLSSTEKRCIHSIRKSKYTSTHAAEPTKWRELRAGGHGCKENSLSISNALWL